MNFRVGTLRNRTEDKQPATRSEPGNRLGLLLAVCCVSQFMVILDLSIVNVALPSIQSDLGFTPVNLQWVVDAYAIFFAGFLMLGGRASDRFGPRRMLAAALVLFAFSSLAGGAATSQAMLIIARSLQGLSGALMAASSLAAIAMSFPQGPARHRAIALWGAMNGAGGAAGALFGGIITQEFGWRWVLLINPPIGVAAAGVAWAVIAETKKKKEGRASSFDLPGAITLTLGQMILVYGIVEAGTHGWGSPDFYVPLIISIVLFVLFTLIEARWARDPLVPFKAITKPLADANTIVFIFSAALFPMWFVSSLYLQEVLGLSPLNAGLVFFPMAVVIMLTARQAGKLVGLFGMRAVLTSGLVLLASGMLLLARIGPSGSSIGYVVLPGLLVASGIGLSVVASTIAATQSVQPAQAGLASGLVNTSRQAGGGLGIALLISFATSWTTHQIGTNMPVPNALTSGFRLAYLIAAGLAFLAAVLAFTLMRQPQAPALAPAARPAGPPPAEQAPQAAQSTSEPTAKPAEGAEGTPPASGQGADQAPARPRRQSPLRLAAVVVGVLGVFAILDFTVGAKAGPAIGAYKMDDAYKFVSAPKLHPPIVRKASGAVSGTPAPGFILTGAFYDLSKPPMRGQSGPLILDNNLQPVWFKPVPQNVVAANLDEQTYHGQPVLTWWQGVVTNTGQTSSGKYVVVNQHYKTVATLHGTGGWVLTLHTMVIDGDHAWVTANKNVPMNLSKWGGVYNGTLVDSALQEYDLKTGKLIWSWDAFKHIGLDDTHSLPPGNGFPWDAYHINSIDLLGGNAALVSMRDTWGVYKINTSSGKIDWTLGGNHSDFKFGRNAEFKYQHDVTLLPDGDISMFDDHCCFLESGGTYLPPTGPSRAEVLRIDVDNHTATLVSQYRHHDEDGRQGTDASYMGSAQLLPNGNVFVGYGNLPFFAEYSKSGTMVMDALFPGPDLTYRAIKIPPTEFVGSPLTPPHGAVRQVHGKTTVYASWNGATQVASWRVLGGSSGGQLTTVTTVSRSGFETAIPVSQHDQVYKLQALDSNGKVLGTSKPFGSGA
ncbi:MAG TPA: MFS transporter [Streptosporangiaceae bacterium]|jgi:EmrB/QacA subfamily drug resistance transporter|nr:MFS transporter [Streptosporangiaceae bacterium]